MNRTETLDKAKACVCGQRENEYGSPEDNFATIADFWTVYKGTKFTARDVAMMMALLKIARIRTGTATDDSYVDLAGYAACGAEVDSVKANKITEDIENEINKARTAAGTGEAYSTEDSESIPFQNFIMLRFGRGIS